MIILVDNHYRKIFLFLWLYSLAAFVGFLSVDGGNDEFVLSLLIIRLSRSLSFLICVKSI